MGKWGPCPEWTKGKSKISYECLNGLMFLNGKSLWKPCFATVVTVAQLINYTF